MVGTPKKENLDRYCDYYGEKGHYTNDYYQLKRQLETALESGKLSHLVRDITQQGRARGRHQGNINGKGKEEDWMNSLITFPPLSADDLLDEPLIIEVEVEGYLVRRVFVDQEAAVQVMFEHCFDNLPSSVKARLTPTQTELVSFSEEQLIPIGKVEIEVAFGSEGLCRRMMMRFMVVRASSPYNIILGRTGMRELRTVSSTIHAMMKFATLRGIATLVTRTTFMFEYRLLEKKAAEQEGKVKEVWSDKQKDPAEEEILINPALLEQKVTTRT
ncbi:hypothetical protein Tco_0748747 [Tanacetum coccineum]|uniref:Reverse transcriptase domain-containing protein n=1 Tax=Tanacetum coccineum TaxID=301880 RepID=A0ABQ4YXG4_9ASTR